MSGPLSWLHAKFASSYGMWGGQDSLRAMALAKAAEGGGGSLCLRCRPAQCCRRLEVPLTEAERLAGGYRLDPARPGRRGPAFLARRPDGACVYLEDELCSIYPRRPSACRDYDCGQDSRTNLVWPSS